MATSNPEKFFHFQAQQEAICVVIDANHTRLADLIGKVSAKAKKDAASLILSNERLRRESAEAARWKAAYGVYCPERGWSPA
jgi:hypothetical protein